MTTSLPTQSELKAIEAEIEAKCSNGRGFLTAHGSWLFGLLIDIVHGNPPILDPDTSGGLDLCGLEKFVKWEETELKTLESPIEDDLESFGPEHVGPHGPNLSVTQIINRACKSGRSG